MFLTVFHLYDVHSTLKRMLLKLQGSVWKVMLEDHLLKTLWLYKMFPEKIGVVKSLKNN